MHAYEGEAAFYMNVLAITRATRQGCGIIKLKALSFITEMRPWLPRRRMRFDVVIAPPFFRKAQACRFHCLFNYVK
jgi:hypothetical protein